MAKFCLSYPFFLISNIVSLSDYTQNWNDLCQLLSNEYSKDSSKYIWVCLSLVTHTNTCMEQTNSAGWAPKPSHAAFMAQPIWSSIASLWKTARPKIIPGSHSQFQAKKSNKGARQCKFNLFLLVFSFELFLEIQSRKWEHH